jgi:hypothetical protein
MGNMRSRFYSGARARLVEVGKSIDESIVAPFALPHGTGGHFLELFKLARRYIIDAVRSKSPSHSAVFALGVSWAAVDSPLCWASTCSFTGMLEKSLEFFACDVILNRQEQEGAGLGGRGHTAGSASQARAAETCDTAKSRTSGEDKSAMPRTSGDKL